MGPAKLQTDSDPNNYNIKNCNFKFDCIIIEIIPPNNICAVH